MTRACASCGTSIDHLRSHAEACEDQACRRAVGRRNARRRDRESLTEEDWAAMRRANELVPIPVPLLTPDQIRAHLLANAERT